MSEISYNIASQDLELYFKTICLALQHLKLSFNLSKRHRQEPDFNKNKAI